MTQKTNWKGGTKTHELTYTYDTLGNILTEADTVNGTSVSYTYDRMGQLTGAVHSSGRVESYTYDNAGNILTFNNGTKSHALAYGDSQWTDLLTAVDGQSITYDAIGNPLSYYDGYRYTFTWTEGRRLASVQYGSQLTRYLYDANGLRTKKINPNGTYVEYYIVDGRYLGEIHYTASGGVDLFIRYNYDESGSVVGISLWNSGYSNAWEDYYFVKNLQGDVLKVYRESDHAVAASYSYDSWGNILATTGSLNFDGRAIKDLNPFRYRTYYYDNETWFYYLQSRYYDPAIGRFINADAYASTGQGIIGHNMFAYCGNNPIAYADHWGYCPYSGTAEDFRRLEAGLPPANCKCASRYLFDNTNFNYDENKPNSIKINVPIEDHQYLLSMNDDEYKEFIDLLNRRSMYLSAYQISLDYSQRAQLYGELEVHAIGWDLAGLFPKNNILYTKCGVAEISIIDNKVKDGRIIVDVPSRLIGGCYDKN